MACGHDDNDSTINIVLALLFFITYQAERRAHLGLHTYIHIQMQTVGTAKSAFHSEDVGITAAHAQYKKTTRTALSRAAYLHQGR